MARLLPAKWVWWYRDKRCQMGYSKRIYNDKKWNKTVAPLRPTFESLGLKEDDVARLHEQFLKIDKDGSGTIELWEMLDHLDLKRNRFAKRVFAIFDVDGSNEIDFKEFVVALWQYCTLGRAQLIMFAFDLYDRDSSGAIDFEEFNTMLKELYGPVWKSTSELRSIEPTRSRGKAWGARNSISTQVRAALREEPDRAEFTQAHQRAEQATRHGGG